jgi:hypothetical protein
MKSTISLGRLPELQHLGDFARGKVIREWRRQLPLSFHPQEIALRLTVIVSFIFIRFLIIRAPLRWYDAAWLFAAYMLGYLICVRLLYLKRRDVLAAILRRAEFAV